MTTEAKKRKTHAALANAEERAKKALADFDETQEEIRELVSDLMDSEHLQDHEEGSSDGDCIPDSFAGDSDCVVDSPSDNGEDETELEIEAVPLKSSQSKSAYSGLVASVEYVHGKKRETIPLNKLSGYKKDPARLLWVGLKDPTEAELQKVCLDLQIVPEAQEEIILKHRRPKMIDYGDYIQVVTITVTRSNKKLVFGEMQMIFGVGFVLTVRRGGAMSNTSLRERMESCPELIARGSDFVVAEILDVYADSCVALAARLETEVNQAEHKLMVRGFKETDVQKLYKQRRGLLRIHTSISPVIEISRKLSMINSPIIEKDSRSYFSIVSDRISRIDEQINSLREALAFAFEASLMIGQSHQTDITKKLAAWAAMLAVPTAVAGIYGMNFENMPELQMKWGYPIVMTFIFVICMILYWRFKKSGWL